MSKKKQTSDAVKILRNLITGGDDKKEAKLDKDLKVIRQRLNVAQEIYDARIQAGLTQEELASKIKTHKSAISRFESSDYKSHSIATLEKIAFAVGGDLIVKIIPATQKKTKLNTNRKITAKSLSKTKVTA